MKLSHIFAMAALPLALVACKEDSKKKQPELNQDVAAAKALVRELNAVLPIDSIETEIASLESDNNSLENLLAGDAAELNNSLDLVVLSLQQALLAFCDVDQTDPENPVYSFKTVADSQLVDINSEFYFGNWELAGSYILTEKVEVVVDPDTQVETTVTTYRIEGDGVAFTNTLTDAVISLNLALLLPEAPTMSTAFTIETLALTNAVSGLQLSTSDTDATLALPLFMAEATEAAKLVAPVFIEQYEGGFAVDNLQDTLLTGNVDLKLAVSATAIDRESLAVEGTVVGNAASFEIDYSATTATGFKAELLNAAAVRVGSDASDWVYSSGGGIGSGKYSNFNIITDQFTHNEKDFSSVALLDDDGTLGLSWTSSDSETDSISYFETPAHALEALLAIGNAGVPTISYQDDDEILTFDVTGLGEDLDDSDTHDYKLSVTSKTRIKILKDDANDSFEVRINFGKKSWDTYSKYYFNGDDFSVASFIYDELTRQFIEQPAVAIEGDFPVFANMNEFLDSTHAFSGKNYLDLTLNDLAYTAVPKFDFELDIDGDGDLTIAETDENISSAKVTSIDFFENTCASSVDCVDPVEFDFAELGVSKHEKETDTGEMLQVEETTDGILFTLSKDTVQVLVSSHSGQNIEDGFELHFGDLKMIVNVSGATATGTMEYKGKVVGSIGEQGDSYVISYID